MAAGAELSLLPTLLAVAAVLLKEVITVLLVLPERGLVMAATELLRLYQVRL